MPGNRFYRKIISLFFVIFFFGKLSAFELFQFSIAPKYALEWGQMNEYVLYSNGNKLSELNWQIDSVNLLGFNATMGWEMILLEADCMWGFPKLSGSMEDSDWLNTSNYGMKTDWSKSENNVEYLGNLELRLGVNVKIFDFWYLIPYVNISYSRIKFESENGYGWYGDKKYSSDGADHYWSDPQSSYMKTGSLCPIAYERETFNYGLGIKTRFSFFERYTFSLDFGLAIFTQINAIDKHYLTISKSSDRAYLDKIQGVFKSFSLGTDLDVKIWKGLSAGAGFNFHFINQAVGASYSKEPGENSYKRNAGANSAASGYSYNFELFVRYSF